ncbi:MAG: rhomboid family intramembrane serine protease [Candidatus Omnitrophica bacterium]|nr:rhomboid family intramembrane serine protease [Candidatus Omnitrophota bacterium]
MIPLRDENPTRTFPFVTLGLIVANAIVFYYELSLAGQLEKIIHLYGLIPYEVVHFNNLRSLVTSMFFHGSLMHIIGNMLYLWIFGNNIEDRLGHINFIFFYLLCGLTAAIGHIIVSPFSKIPTIGASGAVSGVLGAYLVLYPRAKVLTLVPFFYYWRLVKIEAKWFLLIWIFFQIINGSMQFAMETAAGVSEGGVAWFAHIAGFFGGIFLLKLFDNRKYRYV